MLRPGETVSAHDLTEALVNDMLQGGLTLEKIEADVRRTQEAFRIPVRSVLSGGSQERNIHDKVA